MKKLENIHPFDSNPEGREVRVDSSILEGDGAAFQEQQAKTWLDQPIPTLGDLTPRQAAADGRTTEVRALLPQDLGSKEVARLRETLGLPGQPRAPWQEKGAQP